MQRYNNNFTSLCSTLNFYTISKPNSLIFRQNFFEKSSNGKSWVRAFLGDKEERIDLHQLGNKVIFDGLTYICTYSVEAFKELVHCKKLYVKVQPNTRQLYFTYGANIGFVFLKGMPKEPVIPIVVNSSGKIFPLLMENQI